ncbi:basic 7S globulin-like [Olea europaea subsp. europaea]|uniref:Basic 7S globulin-like n=1 Tax=Olea europaea subsp. europaea TaxID=158383 RepID=A0A8S0SQN9_OLEEU|nr:basic 7S globulin-like [Olea europaea subsp. europaea]
MAFSFNSFVLFFAILLSTSYAQNGLILPIRKDTNTLQHYTSILMGSNRATVNAVIDLSERFLWFECDNYTSSTYAPIPCNSQKCEIAKGSGCLVECQGPQRPGCTNNTCGASPFNPFESFIPSGTSGEDTLYSNDHIQVPQFSFACTVSDYSKGLASGTTGILGLARTQISLHKQVANKLNLPDKFSLCLPSSGLGKLYVGGGSSSKSDVSKSLITTPLIINPVGTGPAISVQGEPSDEYFINVKSIRVQGEPLSVKSSYFNIDKDGVGGNKINTMINFTTLHSSIYKPLTRAFVKAASDMKIKSVDAVAPFRACFSSSTISKTSTGPSVPIIELVLPGNDVSWKIYGANSMFQVNKNVICLAFVDGGSSRRTSIFPSTSIVIGTYQLEDNLLEFDLVSSQLRFSSSLLVQNKTCSRL